jgi:hypothetical protein
VIKIAVEREECQESSTIFVATLLKDEYGIDGKAG